MSEEHVSSSGEKMSGCEVKLSGQTLVRKCEQLRRGVRTCLPLHGKLRRMLQRLGKSHHISVDEASEVQAELCELACQISEMCHTEASVQTSEPSEQTSEHTANPLLEARAAALQWQLAKLRLAAVFLAHQLVAVAIRALVSARWDCQEALSAGLCVLSRELQGSASMESAAAAERACGHTSWLQYRNTCPQLLAPSRRLTLTRLLQLAASQRAEAASKVLLAALADTAPPSLLQSSRTDHEETVQQCSSSGEESEQCGASSLEVARELLLYASPRHLRALTACVAEEQRLPACLLAASRDHAPQLAGPAGAQLLQHKDARSKVLAYYKRLLWGDAGTLADHVLLWWQRPLGRLWTAQRVLRWLRQIQQRELGCSADSALGSSVSSLCEALAAHHSIVSWDSNFRRTLVTPSGRRFAVLLAALVRQVEASGGAAVEQIPLLHRLDHSLHSYRLWVHLAARRHLGGWRVLEFVEISQRDIHGVMVNLKQFKVSEVYQPLPLECVHDTVCAKMRCKLVSEVKANMAKLESTPVECIQVLAAVCRTVSLATLHMVFPGRRYWQGDGPPPQIASRYVSLYLERVLRPVLGAISTCPVEAQQHVGGLALRLVCEAWLDHIYQLRIRFSEWGALQLLADFGAVPTWLEECANLNSSVERSLVRSEVLRRCEGVGRLLLRSPGESLQLQQQQQNQGARGGEESPGTPLKDSMPAEMFVTNQEKWLELRARRKTTAAAAAMLCCR